MKRIYVILFAVALSTSLFSCEKTSSEKAKDHMEGVGDSIKNDVKNESEKTTKNGDDAH